MPDHGAKPDPYSRIEKMPDQAAKSMGQAEYGKA